MNYVVDMQIACNTYLPFSEETLVQWVKTALRPYRERAELTLRFVDVEEMQSLNHAYRQQNKPTNVLAFPATYPQSIALDYPLLGDVIICPAVLSEESIQLNTPLENHWAHIVIHGVLHLLGYDHIIEQDAQVMQQIEIELLQQLGYSNPYQKEDYLD